MEQTLEWNTGLYLFFVDFEKSFDPVDWEVLWKILQHYGIPEKNREDDPGLLRWLPSKGLEHELWSNEVRQGCLLSSLLFLVALDWVSRHILGDNETGSNLPYCGR